MHTIEPPHNRKQPFSDSPLYKTGLILLVVLWLASVYNVLVLPEIIPVHFNGEGTPDRHGSKSVLLILPLTGTILFIFIKYLINHPHLLNYPVAVNALNSQRQFKIAQTMLAILNICILSVYITKYPDLPYCQSNG
jgi:uncharacterized membrane protein